MNDMTQPIKVRIRATGQVIEMYAAAAIPKLNAGIAELVEPVVESENASQDTSKLRKAANFFGGLLK